MKVFVCACMCVCMCARGVVCAHALNKGQQLQAPYITLSAICAVHLTLYAQVLSMCSCAVITCVHAGCCAKIHSASAPACHGLHTGPKQPEPCAAAHLPEQHPGKLQFWLLHPARTCSYVCSCHMAGQVDSRHQVPQHRRTLVVLANLQTADLGFPEHTLPAL